jgi:tRNA nucleotidyltransferase (CCA-adding enzyme)
MSEPYIQHTTISEFADEKVNLKREVVSAYREQVNSLRDRLGKYIQEHPDYSLVKMLHAGSVMKGTALKTVNDMDVGVYVRPSNETTDERRLIPWLSDRLKEVYSNMKPDQFELQDHCVTISFRGSGLNVDVVPVIYEGDPEDRGFLITKDTGERVLTSIPLHLKFIRSRKDAQQQHFAQVVRFMKWWVRQRKIEDESFRFKSFMVELVCAHLADNGLDMSDYPQALQRIFTYIVSSGLKKRISFTDYYKSNKLPAPTQSPMEIFDPVNPENNVAGKYSERDRQRLAEAAHDALDALTEAHYATTQGRAEDMWRIVLGPSFRVN